MAAVNQSACLLHAGRYHASKNVLLPYLQANETNTIDAAIEDKHMLSFAYSLVAANLHQLELNKEAADFVKSGIAVAEPGDETIHGSLNQNLGALHNELANYTMACAFHECALEHYRSLGDVSGEAAVSDNFGYALVRLALSCPSATHRGCHRQCCSDTTKLQRS